MRGLGGLLGFGVGGGRGGDLVLFVFEFGRNCEKHGPLLFLSVLGFPHPQIKGACFRLLLPSSFWL